MVMKIKDLLSGTLLIAGTTIGAGMLGIPVITSKCGFFPAFGITIIVWLFMLSTGLLFLEATLWMHHFWNWKETNILSMTKKYLGSRFKILTGGTFIFLYYCLMIAYFAAGAPLLNIFFRPLGFSLSGWPLFAVFGIIFGAVVAFGIKFVDRLNYILMLGLVISYLALIAVGYDKVNFTRLVSENNFSFVWFALPVLFSAFGYHNVIPSLTTHFGSHGKVMRYSIFLGSLFPCLIYIIWQWLIIGALPKELLFSTLQEGGAITLALEKYTGHKSIVVLGNFFGFFAITTSLLGVAFSVVDFLGDGLGVSRKGKNRLWLCLFTFIPPFIFVGLNPGIFLSSLGIAGGYGEAFLNGILPVWLVWMGRYVYKHKSDYELPGGKITLTLLLLFAVVVMIMETILLIKGW